MSHHYSSSSGVASGGPGSHRAWIITSAQNIGIATSRAGMKRACSDIMIRYADELTIIEPEMLRMRHVPLLQEDSSGQIYAHYSYLPYNIIGVPKVGDLCCCAYLADGTAVFAAATYEDLLDELSNIFHNELTNNVYYLTTDDELTTVVSAMGGQLVVWWDVAKYYG